VVGACLGVSGYYMQSILKNPIASAVDCSNAKPTVTYLVSCIIFFLPSSPDFCISSSEGIATAKSCMIIDDVTYGPTPSENMVKLFMKQNQK